MGSLGALRAITMFVVGALAACTPAVDVHTERPPSARFDHYRSFTFQPAPGAPIDYAPSPQSEHVKSRIGQMADDLLRSKGYVPAIGALADLRMVVWAGRREERIVAPDPNAPRFARREREEDVFEGSFVIDAIDVQTGKIAWSGSVRVEKVEPGTVDEGRLRRAVAAVLTSFPAR
jgi:Domain of unknown function (DUF4136)